MQDSIDLTRRWVHRLSSEIGIRLSGTDSDREAADFAEAEFREIFPQVIRHEYRFLGWRPHEEGTLEMAGESHSTRLAVQCPSTPAGGCRGRLRRFGDSHVYGIWEEGAAGPGAHIMSYRGLGGQAICMGWQPFASIPAGIVGQDMGERLARAAAEGEEVTFRCRTEHIPNSTSWNIEGIIPGDPDRWIVVVAHYDSPYVSPGANDNAASVACLPGIGKLLLQGTRRGNAPTLHFLATGGEEIGLQGAHSYVRDRRWSGDAEKLVFAMNFDSLTWGDTLQVAHAGGVEAFVDRLEEVCGGLQLSAYDGTCKISPLGPDARVDSVPFRLAGLPVININTAGDEETTALWHTPQDTEDRVPWARVDDGLALFSAFLERL